MNYQPRYGHSEDCWFRIGNYGVSTTVFVVGLGVISMIVWAVEGVYGPLFRHLALVSDGFSVGSVLEGDLWRLCTWPIPNQPSIWTIILLAIFYMLGNQLERMLGRWRFALFLIFLTIVPAVIVTVVEAISGIEGWVTGLRMVEVGVLVAFVAHFSNVRFWPGIPGWVIVVVILGLDVLQAIARRDEYLLVVLICTVAVALLGIRSFGFATQLSWVPKLSLFLSVDRSTARARRVSSTRRRSRDQHLRVVLAPEEPTSPEVDALLDQVASEGLDSLSSKQRKQLEAYSKRLRRRNPRR
ncbi:MAG: hypothetical protein F4X48_02930 [Acidimicrobiia bacterium]|nr:hypothetical protein [Acidimicrobiia bacterium]MYC57532.1 hypothetical protein [Acidimicrobiia bacterium]MYI30104.1 hypothetical protein [Acidimicrobiia bacterium]